MSDCIAAASTIDRVIETINGAGPSSDDSVAVIAVEVPPCGQDARAPTTRRTP